jgi:pimeloyl-ACP methyl ester carboxylesterase
MLNYREWLLTRFALEQLSGQFYGDNVDDWERWWTVAKDHFSLKKRVADETGDGGKSRTGVARIGGVEVGVNMTVAGREGGYPLLVLPWRGYEPDYFRPYFHGLEDVMKVHYVRMPEIGDFKGLARGAENNIINYPTEILADALGSYMSETGLEKFGVLAHGPGAGALAMFLLKKHPDKVTHLVFVNPRSAGNRYREALESVKREGRKRANTEVVKGVDNVFVDKEGKPNYEPADAAEKGGIHRAIGNLRYADPTAPEIMTMSNVFQLPGGSMVMNDDTWSCQNIFDGNPPHLPALVCYGALSPWSPAGDVQAVAKFFGARLATFASSAEEPYLSETYFFTGEVRNLFRSVLSLDKDKK